MAKQVCHPGTLSALLVVTTKRGGDFCLRTKMSAELVLGALLAATAEVPAM